jgi:hypothetical protein
MYERVKKSFEGNVMYVDADFILDDICYPRGEMSYILYMVGILFSQRKMLSN